MNEIPHKLGVTVLENEKLDCDGLGYVERKTEEDVVLRAWKIEVGGHRRIGRRETEVE